MTTILFSAKPCFSSATCKNRARENINTLRILQILALIIAISTTVSAQQTYGNSLKRSLLTFKNKLKKFVQFFTAVDSNVVRNSLESDGGLKSLFDSIVCWNKI